jgi:hypothetical protein
MSGRIQLAGHYVIELHEAFLDMTPDNINVMFMFETRDVQTFNASWLWILQCLASQQNL